MKPFEAFQHLESPKANFTCAVGDRLFQVPGVISVTFTGSFVEKPGLTSISDIDVVVVVDVLTQARFTGCRDAVIAVSPKELGLPQHRLIINDSFGPLKFDEPGVVVVHLMVYDVGGHRDHVLKSPFTCLDWERSSFYAGRSLRSLFPVLALQPRQFFEVRRSLNDYLEDISSGTISFRRHCFDGDIRSEILERLPLDYRHQGEYAYHIVRNLVANYAKLIFKENRALTQPELLEFWISSLPQCADFVQWFAHLSEIKQARKHEFPADTLDQTREFLKGFAREIECTWTQCAVRHLFIRHARTELNDGSFLGQHRDPPIVAPPAVVKSTAQTVFSSPALRCQQTARSLLPNIRPILDARLHEIDYGKAEGLDFSRLKEIHPEIINGWQHGEDPVFPDGENTAAVAARLNSFLSDLPAEPSVTITHNVVLRCLVGSCLNLPMSSWHRIPIAHLDQFEVVRLDGSSYLDLSPRQITVISDALAGHIT